MPSASQAPGEKNRIDTEKAPEAIVRHISERIVSGALQPGDKLPSESTLAHQLGVAPMTLRAALASLRELGLVQTRRGRYGGTYVRQDVEHHLHALDGDRQVSTHELRDLCDWRRAVSGEAISLAALRRTRKQLEDIEDASREFDAQVANLRKRRLADTRLHVSIATASGSPRLRAAEQDIQQQLTRLILRLPNLASVEQAVAGSHAKLIRAIASGNSEQARIRMIAHVESTYDWCYALLSKAESTEKSDSDS